MRRYSKLNFSANTGKKRGVISMKFMMVIYASFAMVLALAGAAAYSKKRA